MHGWLVVSCFIKWLVVLLLSLSGWLLIRHLVVSPSLLFLDLGGCMHGKVSGVRRDYKLFESILASSILRASSLGTFTFAD
jgi:hypothetical protein